ncbi:MAG: ParB/RepB/Spo0J family partition protein [Patescibacteria group bacterium]|nr:ParB/RepB/Spo0J family partition protein [Patescibacteria group bacterium]MDD5715728.1 ParB/RepB/Spo0J family partition protein [Patescibacteria group bacterium]
MVKSTLGRGLGSLIPQKLPSSGSSIQQSSEVSGDSVLHIPIGAIQPNPQQPRQHFDRPSLEDLIGSIKEHGIIQPLIVIKLKDGYELIAGERRLRAAKMLGLTTVPAIVRSASEQEKLELALVENVQRQNLNPIEKAYGYERLMEEFTLTQEAVAKKVGQNRATVANTLRLLTLSPEIQRAIAEGGLTEGHAKALLAIKDAGDRDRLFKSIIAGGLTVRDTEDKAHAGGARRRSRRGQKDPNLRQHEQDLEEALGTRVELRRQGQRGTITVHFYSAEELGAIIRKIVS